MTVATSSQACTLTQHNFNYRLSTISWKSKEIFRLIGLVDYSEQNYSTTENPRRYSDYAQLEHYRDNTPLIPSSDESIATICVNEPEDPKECSTNTIYGIFKTTW